jgi:hypothetical protein
MLLKQRTIEMNASNAGSIADLLASVTAAENEDEVIIIAGAFNLYYTSISKLGGRKHLTSDDIRKPFAICRSLLDASRVEQGVAEMVRGRPQRG